MLLLRGSNKAFPTLSIERDMHYYSLGLRTPGQ